MTVAMANSPSTLLDYHNGTETYSSGSSCPATSPLHPFAHLPAVSSSKKGFSTRDPDALPTLGYTQFNNETEFLAGDPTPISKRFAPQHKTLLIEEVGVILQDWEGYVEEIGADTFIARLLDRTKKHTVDSEVAEIPIEEVVKSDMDLLRVGAIFYFTVRRRFLSNGRQEVVSQIVFRRLPGWHQSTLDKAQKEAAELVAFFAGNEPVTQKDDDDVAGCLQL